MDWKGAAGWLAARAVQGAAKAWRSPLRPLSDGERRLVAPVFLEAVDLDPVRLCAGPQGPLRLGRRAFVIENTVFVPQGALPLPHPVLVHELVHVWQFQRGGHAYIAESIHAQLWGEGYALEGAAAEERAWALLNCEQQASLIELAFEQGYFAGRAVRVSGVDRTAWVERAVAELRAGRGASFA